jgi:bacterioferritin-associated ferredoxin
MIVCHCHGVTDREIKACVQSGARTCAEVGDACGAGSGCGGCASLVSELVQAERHLVVLRSEVSASPRPCLPVLGEAARQSA